MADTLDVLVVSDDIHLRDVATFGFPEDAEIRLAVDSRDAWGLILERQPDCVVVDLQTGSAGGFNLIRSIHQDPRTSEISTLLLLERPQDAWLARQAGATMTRVKPVEASTLVADVESIVGPAKPSPRPSR